MYDKRESMPTLGSYRKFPHVEIMSPQVVNTLFYTANYAVLLVVLPGKNISLMRHPNKLILRDMWFHGYDLFFFASQTVQLSDYILENL